MDLKSILKENEELKSRLLEAEETINSIRNGDVDAIVVSGKNGDKIYTLTSAETPYRLIIEEMDEGAVTINKQGLILYCNPRFAGMVSVPAEHIIGSDFARFISERERPRFGEFVNTILKQRSKEVFRTISHDMSTYLQLSCIALPSNIEGDICIIVSDITELKNHQDYLEMIVNDKTSELKKANAQLSNDFDNLRKTEEALKLSEEKFSKAFNHSPSAITITRLSDGMIIDGNDYVYELLGYRKDEVIGKSSFDLDIWADHNDRSRLVKSISSKGFVKNEEYILQKNDRTKVIVDLSATLIRINNDDCMLASFIDITERRNTEEALRASERRFRSVFDNSLDAILLTIPDGKVISANKAAEEMFGMNESEIISKGREELMVINQKARDAIEIRNQTGKAHTEIICRRKDGTTFIGEVTSNFFKDEDGTLKTSMIIRDITERKMAEDALIESKEALKLSEERFRYALQNAPISVAMQDLDLRYIWAYNQKTARTEEIIGHTDYDIFTQNEAEVFTAVKRKVISEKKSKKGDYWLDRPSGKLYLSIFWDPVFDKNGDTIGIVSATVDMTSLRLAQDELTKLNRILKAMNSSRQKMIYATEEMDYLRQVCDIFINECGYRMIWIGYLEKDEAGSVTPVCHAGIDQGYIDNLRVAINDPVRGNGPTGRAIKTMEPALCRNMQTDDCFLPWRGEARKIGINASVVLPLISSGKSFGAINVYSENPDPFSDDEIRLLSELASDLSYGIMAIRSNLEARKSTEKLNLALDKGGIGTWELDLRTNTLAWDERMSNILGFEKAFYSMPWEDFEVLLEDENILPVKKSIDISIKEDKPFDTVFRLKPSNGETKYVKTNALVEKDHSNRPVKLAGVCYDISEMQKATEKTLLKVNEELLRSNKDLQEFAYVASHDLQEPLRMVSSFTQLLEKKYADKLDQDAKEYIQFAVEGASRMYNLLNDLLQYSRVQTKGKEFSQVDMNYVVREVLHTLQLSIDEKKAIITVENLPVIYADSGQMTRLIQNLVENSLKFSKGTPEISISSRSEKEDHIFSVKDNGIGIESQFYDRIFKIFQRLNPRNEYRGTGIGLAICKRIVERHHGKIWVDSSPGKGSEFCFSIPKSI